MSQPQQPVYVDEYGVPRFKENALVSYLLEHGGLDIGHLAALPFSVEDREQFAQLIGYSVSGFGDLPYATAETIRTADCMAELAVKQQVVVQVSDTERISAKEILERHGYAVDECVPAGADGFLYVLEQVQCSTGKTLTWTEDRRVLIGSYTDACKFLGDRS